MNDEQTVETCGAWIRKIYPGEIHGSRGSVKWGRVGVNAITLAVAPVGGVEPSGGFTTPYIAVIHKTCIAGALYEWAGVFDFDPVEALIAAQTPPVNRP